MELKSLEDYIDLQLFYQTRDLICSTTDCTIPADFYKRSLFGKSPKIETITETYGFQYLGEVLERYRERCGIRLHQTRALALALAECYELLTPSMFTGSQLYDFISQIESEVSDFYLNCALLHIGDSTKAKDVLFETIIQYPFKETQEALLAIYVLQKCIPINDFAIKLATRFLGVHGTLNIYDNEQLYFWFLSTYAEAIRSYKPRDARLLHSLLDLVCKNIKEDSIEYQTLLNAGYSKQEIAYIRVTLPYEEGIPGSLNISSISAERAAYNSVKFFLEASVLENPCILQACVEMLRVYKEYKVRIEGAPSITEHLNSSLKLTSLDTFKYLHTLPSNVKIPKEWFYVDFSNEYWWELYQWLTPEAFVKLFEESLLSQSDVNYDEWFRLYAKYVETDYYTRFWETSVQSVQNVMKNLVYSDYFDVTEILKMYTQDKASLAPEDFQKKWEHMKTNVRYATRHLNSHTVFESWRLLVDTYGITGVGEFYQSNRVLLDTADIHSYQISLSLCPKLLSANEQQELFNWIEQTVFSYEPTCYMKFLLHFLLMQEAKELFPEESRELFLLLKDNFQGYDLDRLCKSYYTEEEYNNYTEEKERLTEEKRKQEKEAARRKYTERLEKELNDSEDIIAKYDTVVLYLNRVYSKGYEAEICLEFFKELFKEYPQIPLSNATSIVASLSKPVKWGTLTWEEFQTILQTMEVCNES